MTAFRSGCVLIVLCAGAAARADTPASDRDKEIALALEAAPPTVTAKTFLPKYQLVASLRAKGKPEPAIRDAVKAAFKNGTLKAPSRPGVIYMMSPHNVVTIDEVKGIAAPFPGHLMFYAPNLTSADLGSDGSPASPLFVVDEHTPHALMIVPVPAGHAAGHTHGAP